MVNRIEKWDDVHGSDEQDQMQAFLDSPGDSYAILQLRSGDETHYERWSSLRELNTMGLEPNFDHYEIVYAGTLPEYENLRNMLEDLYYQFNMDRPEDFHGHSMSVSDVVAIHDDHALRFYFCDTIGFQELRDFRHSANYLRSTEMSLEDDYDMIDGVLNNGMKQQEEEQRRKRNREMSR